MARFPLLLTTLLFASNVFALVVPTAERQDIQIEELVGTFTKGVIINDDCADSITHGDPVGGIVPHSAIKHNNNQCLGNGALDLFLDANAALDASRHNRGKDIINAASASPNSALYAVESTLRRCMGTRFRPGTTIVIVRPDDALDIGFITLEPGMRYMVISDPTLSNLCVYSAPPVMTPDPTPVPVEPTPAMAGDVTMTPIPGTPTAPPPGTGGDDSDGDEETPSPGGETDAETETETEMESSAEPTVEAESEGGDDEDDDDDSPCFPAHATVELEDGSVKRMENVELGDRVKVGDGEYSDVYMFTHKDSRTHHDFVKIDTTAGSTLTVTKGHYIYINDGVAAAGSAKTGDIVELGNGVRTSIASVKIVKSVGLYNPQTIHGDIIVNGIRSSTFTRTIEPSTAQALLTPFRMLYDTLGWSTSMLDNGAEMIAQVLPKGQVAL